MIWIKELLPYALLVVPALTRTPFTSCSAPQKT